MPSPAGLSEIATVSATSPLQTDTLSLDAEVANFLLRGSIVAFKRAAMEEKVNIKDQEQELNEAVQAEEPQDQAGTETPDSSEEQPKEEPATVDEAAIWKDKYLRLNADFDNARKRNARERIELIQNANADLVRELLSSLDDFERAIAHENPDNQETITGLNLIYNKLKKTLESKGLKPMDSLHQAFDTNFHEAITNIPAPSDDLKGKVVDVVEKGYFLNDSVIRYAKVVVGQ